MFIFLIEF